MREKKETASSCRHGAPRKSAEKTEYRLTEWIALGDEVVLVRKGIMRIGRVRAEINGGRRVGEQIERDGALPLRLLTRRNGAPTPDRASYR